jgi:LacI family transcriptional regulator
MTFQSCVDDIPFSAINTPSLTTMRRISRSSIGKMAVDTLLKRIAHPDIRICIFKFPTVDRTPQ